MKHYLKLLNWEINRFSKFYMVLGLVTLVLQFVGVFLSANHLMSSANRAMYLHSLSVNEYVARFGKINVEHGFQSLWFAGPIMLCVAILLLYVFLIWYREWLGKSTFAYRLLMLPTSRMNIYLAKLSAILLFVLGLVTFQLLLLPLQLATYNVMIPSELRTSLSVVEIIGGHELLSIFIPPYFMQFVLYYGAGVVGVIVVFTAILLERSFRLKGIVAGVVYGIAAGLLFALPTFVSWVWYPDYFYPIEVLLMRVMVGALIICGSLWLSSYLLRKKITI
ncbi:hypothetical protein [Paenibacillus sp. 481]|uniref:hypothetical protein n=1 Tax=Paenibacillus sp. 481 TaxID=2835869 RepID=UPI001E2F1883|nr:hypothetical protein [Paenibacillus sp. 481]UHA75452.1 hypothetical protein KIK04_10880 [Paenibacillus sp. 481]